MCSSASAISIRDLSFQVHGRSILNHVNLQVQNGNLCAILGESGSGKSSLLESIAGNIVSGVTVDGLRIQGSFRNDTWRRTHIGLLTQTCVLPNDTRVISYLLFIAAMFPSTNVKLSDRDRVIMWAKRLGIEYLLERKLNRYSLTLSSGEARLVQLCSVLLRGVDILLLDEPTTGLDPASIQKLMVILRSLSKEEGITIIASLHQPRKEELNGWDQFAIMSHGSLISEGPLTQFLPAHDSLWSVVKEFSPEAAEFETYRDLASPFESALIAASLLSPAHAQELSLPFITTSTNQEELVEALPRNEPISRRLKPSLLTQLLLLYRRGLLREFYRVYQFVDLLQMCFEMTTHYLSYAGLLANTDGPSGAFWGHIGPLFTMNIMNLYRGSFTAVYGEHDHRPVIKSEILSCVYSKPAYLIYRLTTTFLVGLPWPTFYFIFAMLIQQAPWAEGKILMGMVGVILTYLCGQLFGTFAIMVTNTFNKGINLTVCLNWLQSLPSGSFHNADSLPQKLAWLPLCSYLYFSTAVTLVGVTSYAVTYTCDGLECPDYMIWWGVEMMGYDKSYGYYLGAAMGYYIAGIVLVVVAFLAGPVYRPR